MKRVLVSAFLACSFVWAQSGLTVEAFDEQSNNNTQLTLRLRLKNNTAETLKNVQAKYLIERDDSRTLNVYPYYMPNATYSLETLSDYLVVNINVDEIAPGTYPNESGISLGMVYSDGENFYKDSDYSYPGKGNFNAAPNIVVMQNGAWLTGELPSSMAAAKLRFKAIQPENSDTRSAWVEIENYGQESVNLSRFVLKNSASHSASIGEFTLKHGEKLRICQDITLECPVDDYSTVIQSLSFGNVGELKLALGSKTVDYVAWGKQGTMQKGAFLQTIPYEEIGMYESYYKGTFFRYIDYIGWKNFAANEINRDDNSLPLARDYNLPDNSTIVLSKNQKPRFSWVQVSGASSYILTILNASDLSLVYQTQTENNFVDVDIPQGSFLWSVESQSVEYGYQTGYRGEGANRINLIIFENEESDRYLENVALLNAPAIGARKDTKMLATSMGNKAKEWGWDREHTLKESMTPEETWRCWAVGLNILNKFYKGNLTQDEIKIMGMKLKGKSELDYFALGKNGGMTETNNFVKLIEQIFDQNTSTVYTSKSDVTGLTLVTKGNTLWQHGDKSINVGFVKNAIAAQTPVLVGIQNSSSGHVMVIDGYAETKSEWTNTETGEVFLPEGSPLFHFVNTDNNGNSYWASPDVFRYSFYVIMETPTFVLNRDPLLAQDKLDSDGDGVIDYDEKYRFETEINDDDSDDDFISDYNEIYAMVNRCTDISDVDDAGETVYHGCEDFVYYDTDEDGLPTYRDPDSDNGGVKDGAEDLNSNGELDDGETDPYNKEDDKKKEVAKYDYDLPNGITIFGRERVALNDGVVCYNTTKTDGGYCDIASSSQALQSTIILGVKATVRNIFTRGGLWLRVRSVVDGSVAAYTLPSLKHPIKKDVDVTIRGKSDAYNTIGFPYSDEFDTWTLDEEPELEHVVKNGETFEWNSSDKYKTLKVEAGGKLVLNPGTFIAKELILDRESTVEFAKPGEATQVVAMDFLDWRTEIINEDLPLVARGFKLITYMQSLRLFTLGANWAGTLYAPNTYTIFGQASNKQMYGRFYTRIAIVHQRTRIFRVDYDPIVPENALAKEHPANENIVNDIMAESSFAAELKGFSRNAVAFETKSAGFVKIGIMSANGVMVKTFSTGNLDAGKHSVVWNSENLPSGRYLVTLSQNGKVSGKFVSLK